MLHEIFAVRIDAYWHTDETSTRLIEIIVSLVRSVFCPGRIVAAADISLKGCTIEYPERLIAFRLLGLDFLRSFRSDSTKWPDVSELMRSCVSDCESVGCVEHAAKPVFCLPDSASVSLLIRYLIYITLLEASRDRRKYASISFCFWIYLSFRDADVQSLQCSAVYEASWTPSLATNEFFGVQ